MFTWILTRCPWPLNLARGTTSWLLVSRCSRSSWSLSRRSPPRKSERRKAALYPSGGLPKFREVLQVEVVTYARSTPLPSADARRLALGCTWLRHRFLLHRHGVRVSRSLTFGNFASVRTADAKPKRLHTGSGVRWLVW